jgi:hypothetical protein
LQAILDKSGERPSCVRVEPLARNAVVGRTRPLSNAMNDRLDAEAGVFVEGRRTIARDDE